MFEFSGDRYRYVAIGICEVVLYVFFFKQKTAYEMRISDWSSDVCSSDLSDAGASDEAAAGDLHLLLPLVPCRSGAVLGGQQRPVHRPAVVHYSQDRGRGEARLTPQPPMQNAP